MKSFRATALSLVFSFLLSACSLNQIFCKHVYTEIDQLASTCTKTGSIIYECLLCRYRYAEEIPLLNHNTKFATCVKPRTCLDCGTQFGDPIDHIYDNKITSAEYVCSEATYELPATYYYACIYCDLKGTATFSYGDPLERCWKPAYYIDPQFGDATTDWYISSSIKSGTSSITVNGYTANLPLTGNVSYDINDEISISLSIGNSIITTGGTRKFNYIISIKNNEGKTINTQGYIPPNGERIIIQKNNTPDVFEMMKTSESLIFHIEPTNSSDKFYRFTLDLTDFIYALNQMSK